MLGEILKRNKLNGEDITYKSLQCCNKNLKVILKHCTDETYDTELGITLELTTQPGDYDIPKELNCLVNEYLNKFKCISRYECKKVSNKAFLIEPIVDIKKYYDEIIDVLQRAQLLTYDAFTEIQLKCDSEGDEYLNITKDFEKIIRFETHSLSISEIVDNVMLNETTLDTPKASGISAETFIDISSFSTENIDLVISHLLTKLFA